MKAGVVIRHEESARLNWLREMASGKTGTPIAVRTLDDGSHFLYPECDFKTHIEARVTIRLLRDALLDYTLGTGKVYVVTGEGSQPLNENHYIDKLEQRVAELEENARQRAAAAATRAGYERQFGL
jgi:hypothetical protein